MTRDVIFVCKVCLVEPERVEVPDGELGLSGVGNEHVEWICPQCGALVGFFYRADEGTLEL
jgi:hypothetical protein